MENKKVINASESILLVSSFLWFFIFPSTRCLYLSSSTYLKKVPCGLYSLLLR